MTHNETLSILLFNKVRETIKLWYQCVAFVKMYCIYRWYPLASFWGSANIWWQTWKPFDNSWTRIKYNWFNSPKEWDVVFWDSRRCLWWHVAIANKFCNIFVLRCVDQNWDGRQDMIQPRWYGYKNVVGWYTRNK